MNVRQNIQQSVAPLPVKLSAHILAFICALACALACTLGLSSCSSMSEEARELYREVLDLAYDEVSDGTWVYTGWGLAWGMESADPYAWYIFYIDAADYDAYKSYFDWDYIRSQNELTEGYNEELEKHGDYVQHCINIYSASYSNDVEHWGVQLKKDTDYFFVQVYNRAIFYYSVDSISSEGNVTGMSHHGVDHDSLTRRLIFHQEGGIWIMEEANLE